MLRSQLGEPTAALLAEATELNKQLNPYSWGPPRIRFTEAETDRARAAGVLLEYGDEAPLVTDSRRLPGPVSHGHHRGR